MSLQDEKINDHFSYPVLICFLYRHLCLKYIILCNIPVYLRQQNEAVVHGNISPTVSVDIGFYDGKYIFGKYQKLFRFLYIVLAEN